MLFQKALTRKIFNSIKKKEKDYFGVDIDEVSITLSILEQAIIACDSNFLVLSMESWKLTTNFEFP